MARRPALPKFCIHIGNRKPNFLSSILLLSIYILYRLNYKLMHNYCKTAKLKVDFNDFTCGISGKKDSPPPHPPIKGFCEKVLKVLT